MTENQLVSIIIPTKNSEATIEKCLESIRNQTYPNIEIILVDNYSRDSTREIAQKYGARIYLKGPERGSQVNFGVTKAKGKYVYRVDSDFILETSVVEEAVTICEVQGYDAVAVHNTSDPTVSFWAKVRKLERDCYADDEMNVATRFIRKDVFEAVGGFDEELVAAEDYDIHNRLLKKSYKIGRIKSKEIHIGEPKTLWEISRKHYYYGKTLVKFVGKNKGKAAKQLSPIRPAFIKHWRKFVRRPILMLGFIVYQLVRYFSAGLGYLVWGWLKMSNDLMMSYYVRSFFHYVDNFGLRKALKRVVYKSLLGTLGVALKRSSININGLKMYLIPNDAGISRELKVFKIHEPLATSMLKRHLKRGMKIIDIGSNIGYYCLLEAKVIGSEGRVVAIEPNPVAFQYLIKNIQTKSLSNVIPKNLALWDEDEFVDFVVLSQSNLCYVKGAKDDEKFTENVVRVPAKTLDSLFVELCQRHNFCDVDLIRMDVEGGEGQIFKGAKKVIEYFLPKIFIELHVPTIGKGKARILLKNLKALGYFTRYAIFRGVDLSLVGNPTDIMIVDIDELIFNPPLLDLLLFLDNDRSKSLCTHA